MFGDLTSSVCVLVKRPIFVRNLFCSVQLNSLHSELANQMADSMVFPLIQFREKDLTGRNACTDTNCVTIIFGHKVIAQYCFAEQCILQK